MSKEPRIQQHDHWLRFSVASDRRPNIYHVVDLADDECSCEDWEFRSGYGQGQRVAYRCKHIIAAREHLLTTIINHLK